VSNTQRGLTLLLIVLALVLLVPGVTQPVVTLSGSIERSALVDLGIDTLLAENNDPRARQMVTAIAGMFGLTNLQGDILVYHSTRSILQAVHELNERGNVAVALLIVLFSVVLPSLKLTIQAATIFAPQHWCPSLLFWVRASSKWSMADVFVIALLVVYLAGQASGEMGGMLNMSSRLEPGFYYFLAYCLFSVASSGLIRAAMPTASASRPWA